MISRKLFAAFITSVIGFFIVPFYFFGYSGGYNLQISFTVSTWTVPTLFIGGVLSSLAIEYYSKNHGIGVSYLKHLVCALICVCLFSFYTFSVSLDLLLISILYVTIFFAVDFIAKYVVARETLFN